MGTLRRTIVELLVLLAIISGQTTLAADLPLPEIPVPLAPDTTLRTGKYFRYAGLELEDEQGEEFTLQGHYWNLYVNYQGEVATVRDHFQRLAESGGRVLSHSGARGLHFQLDRPEGPLYATLHVGGSNYNLELLEPSACPREVAFGNGQYAASSRKDETFSPPVITDYPGSRVTSGKEHDFDRLALEFRENRAKVKKTVEGRYWQKVVQIGEREGGLVHHEEIREAFRLAALDAGAEILDTGNRSLVFHIPDPENGDLWAYLHPQDGKYTLKAVQEEAMRQVLVLARDEMMARLEALGKLTLRGIFFDTAKATLKPESDPALQSALDLLQAYPDLVLEVGGHTDNVGQSADNQVLSEDRANSVRAWLVDRGVAAERLMARGYGEDQPVATNTTDVGRAANRRVELTKISGGKSRDLFSLIKPYPGSVELGEPETLAGASRTFCRLDEGGRIRKDEVTGDGVMRRFMVPDASGKPDPKLSGVQIRSNYRRAVLDLGGEIMAEHTHGLYFQLRDADGAPTLFMIWAPGAKYSITALKEAP